MKDMDTRLTARVVAADIATGHRSVSDVVQATLDRIDVMEPQVQAFVHLDPALVRARAQELDAADNKGPLAGVTVVVKDMIATRDMPTGHNNVRYTGVMTGVDAAPVDTLRAAGAVILGKTVTTEFAATGRGGKTTNPHDPTRTPGGSSSGSAAAVAAGMAAIGLGTQTGGSTIRPASYNGIWGWKPTWNVISREGLKVYSLTCDTLGLYARTAEDFTLLADVFDLDDAPQPDTLAGLKIAYVHPPAWDRVEPPMRDALAKAAAALQTAGATVSELHLPDLFTRIDESHDIILAREGRAAFLNEARNQPDTLHSEFLSMVENRRQITPQSAREAYKIADTCRALMDDILSDYDAIIAPSATSEAPVGLEWTGDPSMNSLWTLLSVPVVSVPGFSGPNGMPLGISVITRRYTDRTAIAIGALAGPLFAASE
ncbi:Asp-tRNAAsn/Glu-tRNAGln amidotransferase A subunit [Thalassovita litoralis]|uniref:Asp-tRNAAsn/Glu-tRNAGln amidotransferase A subunit n=1 Tax=Thalassovita litoralis TaxID=1010611 RepID=A0A521C3X1_9RHOB|nr:amidase [Thalassovita litoralis]SMO54186.1 Asp-tRNAAsn/Glu-tRNAGln amidotransferase A subunit [Thalassovita litoralis]